MSVDDNKALVRRFYDEVWDRGNTDFAFEVFDDETTSGMTFAQPRHCPGRRDRRRLQRTSGLPSRTSGLSST